MRTVFYSAIIAVATGGNVYAGCPESNLPTSYELAPRLSLGTSFKIKSGSGIHGTIQQRWFSLVHTFIYRNAKNEIVATARVNPFSWGTQIDVMDCEGKKIGAMKEEVWKSLFKIRTSYLILDQNGARVGKSEKIDWGNTQFDLHDQRGHVVAHLERPWLRFMDHWSVDVYDKGAIDGRLLVMIGAFKSAADSEKSSAD